MFRPFKKPLQVMSVRFVQQCSKRQPMEEFFKNKKYIVTGASEGNNKMFCLKYDSQHFDCMILK